MSSSTSFDPVERRLLSVLRKYKLGGASLLVAFSGGPDSTALLRAAERLREPCRIHVYAAWVDHGIRPASERAEERRFVESLTKGLGIPCDITEPPSPESLVERAERLGASVEAEAREFRYRGLLGAAKHFHCSRILTAHTSDDQAETLLFRVLSGSSAAGLRGIPEDRKPFLRPFLTLSKAQLHGYLLVLEQDWRTDSTNETGEFLRNRIRHDLLPRIESVFPGYRTALKALAEKSGQDEDLLSELAETALQPLRTDTESSFDARAFLAAHPALRIRALTAEAGRLAGVGKRVPYALIRAASLVDLSANAPPSGSLDRILAQGAGLRFETRDGRVRILSLRREGSETGSLGDNNRVGRDVTWSQGFAFLFESPGTVRIDTDGFCRVYFGPGAQGPVEGSFGFPLLVRSRRAGDRISIPGGYKSVDELLAEWGIRPERRDDTPVLEDEKGIVAVLGSRTGGRDRYRQYSGNVDASLPRLSIELIGFGSFIKEERSAEAP